MIGFAASAHQAWSANIFTTVSDMFPKKAVASVTGIGGMAGAIGGMLIAWLAEMLSINISRSAILREAIILCFLFVLLHILSHGLLCISWFQKKKMADI